MMRRTLVEIAVILLLVGLVLLVWRDSQQATRALELSIAQQEAERAKVQADLATKLKEIHDEKERVQTPAQVIRELPQVINLPAPIQAAPVPQPLSTDQKPGHGGEDVVAEELPDPVYVIPQESLKPLYDRLQDCKACEAREDADQKVIMSLQKELGDTRKAAKGGGWWTRTKRAVKWLAVGAAVGVVAVCGTGHCK